MAITTLLPSLRESHNIDIVIANGENAAAGIGLTITTANSLFHAGIDVITSGNHIWAHKEIYNELDSNPFILRPLNYPPSVPGHGYCVFKGVLIVNIIGRTFIGNFDCPFRAMDDLLSTKNLSSKMIIVDFHAEATSEKVAMGRYLNGRVSGVLGTHTHVGTIDLSILPEGTAYVTDIGMVGPLNSVIGDDVDNVINRFLTQINKRLSVGSGEVEFNAVMLDVDEVTGKTKAIQRIQEKIK